MMQKQDAYGFGIIGLGSIAKTHAEALLHAKGCRLVSGYHANKEKATAFCSHFGAKGYDDLEAFLSDPALDVVLIATPSGSHLESALASIAHKKHVLIEKPLEVTVERCDQLISAAQREQVVLGSIFQSRSYGAAKAIKKALEEGRFGQLTLLDAQIKWYRSQAYYDSAAWRGTWQYDGGGILMNQGIHAIDLLQWFGGPVSEIYGATATLTHERIEVEDTAVATLRFANGALGVIEGTTGTYPGFLKRIEVCGSQGSAILEEDSLLTWKFREERIEDELIRTQFSKEHGSKVDATQSSGLDFAGHQGVFEDFVQALRENRDPTISGKEARKPVEIIEAIYASARGRVPVSLPL